MRTIALGCVLAMACGCEEPSIDLDAAAVDAALADPDAPLVDAAPPDAWDTTNGGFGPPSVTMTAHDEAGALLGSADWSCLGTVDDRLPTATTVALTGTLDDFQNVTPHVDDGTISVFAGTDSTVTSDTDGPTTTSGAYSLTLAVGTAYWGFRISAPDYMDTIHLGHSFLPDTPAQTRSFSVVSSGLATALPAFIGINRTPGTAEVLVTVRDCDGHRVRGAIATVSAASSVATHLGDTVTHYLDSTTMLPQSHEHLTHTDGVGHAVIMEIPTSTAGYVQVWGFPTSDELATNDLVMVSELAMPVVGDTFVIVEMAPLRTP